MENKFTAEILKGYEIKQNTLKATFVYGKGCVKLDNKPIAEFDKIEIRIKPIIKNLSLMNTDGDKEVVTDYDISANLNISKPYSRYKTIDNDSQVDIEISEERICIFKCNVKDIDEKNMLIQIAKAKNIEIV